MPIINFHVPVIAHRGASHNAPENTLAAFRLAKTLSAQWVEFDVMLSADGEAVVIHDETVDRTTNGKGRVCDLTLQQLQALDAGSWFDARYTGERIPTLKEVLLSLQELNLAANIEIKPTQGSEEATVLKVLAEIKQYWSEHITPPLISSFSVPTLRLVRQHSPQAILGLLMDEWFPDWEKVYQELQCTSVNMNQEKVTEDKAAYVKTVSPILVCYTVNSPERTKELLSWGVDAVFSDDLIRVLPATLFS